MSLKERIQWLKFVVHSVPVVVKHHRINVAGDQGEEQPSRWCCWRWLALADVTDSELHKKHRVMYNASCFTVVHQHTQMDQTVHSTLCSGSWGSRPRPRSRSRRSSPRPRLHKMDSRPHHSHQWYSTYQHVQTSEQKKQNLTS